ncbi:hypothetical protein INP83_10875 [Mucilaginibacter sp. 21P]|uniref:hypothetical protein n=1 Tax=Mucilaginibacter sp. 21P TaxID=2778902 RepID=UPI001C58192E|nr:hypothetical protein [Mucilaginibacter sp. 21P]QXV63620.1 hypothetical protein INP83_10875 [Mucilaginibacter sp. 21P]
MKGGTPPRKVKSYVRTVSVLPTGNGSSNCDLYFTADLVNIEQALSNVPVGNYLRLSATSGGRIIASDTSGALCASLDAIEVQELLICMSQGNRYRGRLRHDRASVDVQKIR